MMLKSIQFLLAGLFLAACFSEATSSAQPFEDVTDDQDVAIFASGCFWCTEADFEKLDGVIEAVSGYTGGTVDNPSYRQVVRGGTGHVEAVRITYDPDEVSYETLLDHYWRNVDPFDGDGQFCDRGDSYAPAIFTRDDAQAEAATLSRETVAERFDQEIVVPILPAETFWDAEDYHQDYADKNPVRYSRYRFGCRRDQRLREIWGEEAGGLSQ